MSFAVRLRPRQTAAKMPPNLRNCGIITALLAVGCNYRRPSLPSVKHWSQYEGCVLLHKLGPHFWLYGAVYSIFNGSIESSCLFLGPPFTRASELGKSRSGLLGFEPLCLFDSHVGQGPEVKRRSQLGKWMAVLKLGWFRTPSGHAERPAAGRSVRSTGRSWHLTAGLPMHDVDSGLSRHLANMSQSSQQSQQVEF